MSMVLRRIQKTSQKNLEGIGPVEMPKDSPSLRLHTPAYTRIDPAWWEVEMAVGSCQGEMDGGFGEFCVLSQINSNTYVQTAISLGEPNSWRLEWRITETDGTYSHLFARNPCDDEYTDTLDNVDDVILAFKAFYQNKGLPDSLTWKRYDL
ncbi:MAG: hypothetical protein HZB95_03715 [Nitrosomonadales bacterium]|nr:hypothetical protein [Nitrosomonadales bacterium]